MEPAAVYDGAVMKLGGLSAVLMMADDRIKREAYEVRIRAGAPLAVTLPEGQRFPFGDRPITAEQVGEAFMCLCGQSVYSRQDELAQGFVSVEGGHRAGIGGTAVTENGRIVSVRDISSINLRIAREYRGCSDRLTQLAFPDGRLCGLLLAGAPCSGKTTMLRDIARSLSERENRRIAVIDERGELRNAGTLCDILNGFPKAEGMLRAVRTLSPEAVICDEIGSAEEAKALTQCVCSGVAVIAAMHAGTLAELYSRPQARLLLGTGAFEKIALLSSSPVGGIVTVTEVAA